MTYFCIHPGPLLSSAQIIMSTEATIAAAARWPCLRVAAPTHPPTRPARPHPRSRRPPRPSCGLIHGGSPGLPPLTPTATSSAATSPIADATVHESRFLSLSPLRPTPCPRKRQIPRPSRRLVDDGGLRSRSPSPPLPPKSPRPRRYLAEPSAQVFPRGRWPQRSSCGRV